MVTDSGHKLTSHKTSKVLFTNPDINDDPSHNTKQIGNSVQYQYNIRKSVLILPSTPRTSLNQFARSPVHSKTTGDLASNQAPNAGKWNHA